MIDASSFPAVQVTLWLLAVFSVATWGLIAAKGVQHLRVKSGNKRYAKAFGASPNLQAAAEIKNIESPLARLAISGFNTLRSSPTAHEQDLEHAWDRHELLERDAEE